MYPFVSVACLIQCDTVYLPVSSRALEVMPVMDEEFVFIASRGQQDAFRDFTPQALHAQPLIAFESGSGTRALIDGWFAGSGLTIAPVMQRQLAVVMRQDKILSKGIAGIIRIVQNPPAA